MLDVWLMQFDLYWYLLPFSSYFHAEPTNNLDIESIDALCEALKVYNGGVILVSHDARLIETTDCQLWVVDDHNVTPWVKGFDNYREHLLQKLEEQMSAIMPGSGERPDGEEEAVVTRRKKSDFDTPKPSKKDEKNDKPLNKEEKEKKKKDGVSSLFKKKSKK